MRRPLVQRHDPPSAGVFQPPSLLAPPPPGSETLRQVLIPLKWEWPSGKVSASGPEGSRFETRFRRRSAWYVGLLHVKSCVQGQTSSRWCGEQFPVLPNRVQSLVIGQRALVWCTTPTPTQSSAKSGNRTEGAGMVRKLGERDASSGIVFVI
ncbi:hypothetical protein AVEN_95566-1 [Araneus ventricosus]|uniref:Uncharacterized protein n=1 Tax=Araneus ventricosus TaxID=182803 RepID=A0A4Y2WN99_ARAVE|nr:hypothetical protein AVEN_95566-1 [Araneus ventricosus]